MEKSLDATNEKVSHHIYDDIAFVILSKLPLKSFIRFSCVRKSWSLLFQNSYFMKMFRTNFLSKDHSHYNDTSILLQHITLHNYNVCVPKLYSLSGERFENMVKLDWPNPYEDPFDFIILGSVSINGILCIQDAGRAEGIRCIEELGRYVLWNPATGEFQITPTSTFAFESPCWDPIIDFHGFGYDRIRDDYKVIRHVVFHPGTDEDEDETWKDGYHSPLWEIYCLNSNSWKKLDIDMPRQYDGNVGVQVYVDGVCHWWGESESDSESESETCDEVYLASFDLSNEVFVKTSIPSNMDDTDTDIGIRCLVVLNGAIGWITNYHEATTFHISILGEVGVKESWTKLFVVGPLSCVEHLIGVGKKDDIFFKKNDNELVWFNLNTQRIEELGIKSDDGCKIVLYKESFLPFARINN
ncbi:F-box/kelch-repeat protein At3g06240-like [Vicia villosa]|uniref:F-box/kelch-repeat protein At3g06240-like n=1 Tax=Vicia villosa TaxID=3911 RepID=UPI00273BA0DD|nr:F-box/kelch-repeat protein At3g06240-like [Vicia villosa]